MKNVLYANLTSTRDDSSLPANANSGAVLPTHTAIRDTRELAETPVWLPELVVWIPVVLIVLLSLSTGYLFWARVTSAWPFSQ